MDNSQLKNSWFTGEKKIFTTSLSKNNRQNLTDLRQWAMQGSVAGIKLSGSVSEEHLDWYYSFDEFIDCFNFIQEIEIEGLGIASTETWDTLYKLTELKYIYIKYDGHIKYHPTIPKGIDLSRFPKLERIFTDSLCYFSNLEHSSLESLQIYDGYPARKPNFDKLSLPVSLKHLDIITQPLKDLKFLAPLHNLYSLNLYRVKGLANIEVISTLKNLIYLGLLKCNCSDLSNLSSETVTHLTIPDVLSLGFLANFPALEELNLGSVQDADLSPITNHPTLKKIIARDKRNKFCIEVQKDKPFVKYKFPINANTVLKN